MSSPTPSQSRRVIWVYVFSIAIWGFDYHAATSGAAAAFQGLLLALYLCCFVWMLVVAARHGVGAGPLWVLMLVTLLFMTESSIVGAINDQPAHNIEVTLLPVSMYLSASVLTYLTLSLCKEHTGTFLDGVRWACIASTVEHVVVTYLTQGIDLTKSRFEVLSGAVIPCIAVMAVGLAQKLSRLDLVVVLLNLGVSLLSVTRTLVIVLGAQVAMVLAARPGILFRRTTLRAVALVGATVLVVVALDLAAGAGLTARWTERLFLAHKLGTDPSGLLRLAETKFMWDRFTTSPFTIVFGNGLAAITSAIGREDVEVAMLVGRGSAVIHMIGIGHENYVSILYVSGLFGGSGLLVVQALNGLQSVTLIRKLTQRPPIYPDVVAHVGIWGGLTIAGMLTVGFLSGTFNARDECLWYGIGTGMFYWAREIVSTARKTTAASDVAG
jgi:hypothetical protein